jgi:hypothetical protein
VSFHLEPTHAEGACPFPLASIRSLSFIQSDGTATTATVCNLVERLTGQLAGWLADGAGISHMCGPHRRPHIAYRWRTEPGRGLCIVLRKCVCLRNDELKIQKPASDMPTHKHTQVSRWWRSLFDNLEIERLHHRPAFAAGSQIRLGCQAGGPRPPALVVGTVAGGAARRRASFPTARTPPPANDDGGGDERRPGCVGSRQLVNVARIEALGELVNGNDEGGDNNGGRAAAARAAQDAWRAQPCAPRWAPVSRRPRDHGNTAADDTS